MYRISSYKTRGPGINISHSLQMQGVLENTVFSLHKIVRIAGIIRGRALYEEIHMLNAMLHMIFFKETRL